MCGSMCRISGMIVLGAALLMLNGCEFGSDNVGDIHGSNQPVQSNEHQIPESQKTGSVTGEPGPEMAR
jgi:hypothetical protein